MMLLLNTICTYSRNSYWRVTLYELLNLILVFKLHMWQP